MQPDQIVREAIANNVAWVCSVNACAGAVAFQQSSVGVLFQGTMPEGYPNLITQERGLSSGDVKDVIDKLRGLNLPAGFGIKDSHAELDLAPFGFERLLEGRWISYPAAKRGEVDHLSSCSMSWINQADAIEHWCAAAGLESFAQQVNLQLLAARADVHVLEVRCAGDVVAGAIFNLSGNVAGVSNVFGRDGACDH